MITSTSRSERDNRSSFHTTEHVAFAELIENPVEFGPVPASSGGLLTIDALAPSGFERSHLGSGVLFVGGDSGVADQNCTNVSPIELVMHYLFATQETSEM